jgi:23S rRNA pseudouridine1911/1915/1917 synthase
VNEGYCYTSLVELGAGGQRLEDYLDARYQHASRSQWCAHIESGRVLLDGRAAVVGQVLRGGEALEWHRPAWEEPDAPCAFQVLYQDEEVLVVDKPAGLPTMPGGGFLQNTLVHQLRLLHPDAAPSHRLGRWTTGAVLCARTPAAGAAIAAQFSRRSLHKRYRALASGCPVWDALDITAPIGTVPYPPLGELYAAVGGGRRATSQVAVVARQASAFLCDVVIGTGRPHQIRIHLAWAGHPLVGDPLYAVGGVPIVGGSAVPGDPGYLLHAAEIAFDHPGTGRRIVVTAPLPAGLGEGDPGFADGNGGVGSDG